MVVNIKTIEINAGRSCSISQVKRFTKWKAVQNYNVKDDFQ
jgi:hypothetical protein